MMALGTLPDISIFIPPQATSLPIYTYCNNDCLKRVTIKIFNI